MANAIFFFFPPDYILKLVQGCGQIDQFSNNLGFSANVLG